VSCSSRTSRAEDGRFVTAEYDGRSNLQFRVDLVSTPDDSILAIDKLDYLSSRGSKLPREENLPLEI
jgi:hypothetical protein